MLKHSLLPATARAQIFLRQVVGTHAAQEGSIRRTENMLSEEKARKYFFAEYSQFEIPWRADHVER